MLLFLSNRFKFNFKMFIFTLPCFLFLFYIQELHFSTLTHRVYYQNCRKLNTKLEKFYRNSSDKHFDIIGAVEIWVKESVANEEIIDLNEYNVYRSDRNFDLTKLKILKIILNRTMNLKSNKKYTIVGVYIPTNSLVDILD